MMTTLCISKENPLCVVGPFVSGVFAYPDLPVDFLRKFDPFQHRNSIHHGDGMFDDSLFEKTVAFWSCTDNF